MALNKNGDVTISMNNGNVIQEDYQKSEITLNNNTWIPQTDEIKKDYHTQRLGQSKWAFRISIVGSLLGFAIIIWSVIIGVKFKDFGWVGVISGTITETVAALFYAISNKTNEKISEFFKELTKDSNVENSIRLASKVENGVIRDELLVKLSLHLSGISEEKICKNTKDVCQKNEGEN